MTGKDHFSLSLLDHFAYSLVLTHHFPSIFFPLISSIKNFCHIFHAYKHELTLMNPFSLPIAFKTSQIAQLF